MAFRVQDVNPALAVNGGISAPDSWNFDEFVSQVAATCQITLGGTETDDDVLTFTFNSQQLPGGTYAVEVTTADAESLTAIATALKNAINDDPLLSSLGITATSIGAAVTVTWIPGPLGNFATIVLATSLDATETAAITPFTGGAGYVTPQEDYTLSVNGCVVRLFYRKPIETDYQTLSTILAAGASVI